MARKRASMREGPLAELFRATEAAQKQAEQQEVEPPPTSDQERLVLDETVEYTPDFAQPKTDEPSADEPKAVEPEPEPEPKAVEPEPTAEVAVAPKPKPKSRWGSRRPSRRIACGPTSGSSPCPSPLRSWHSLVPTPAPTSP